MKKTIEVDGKTIELTPEPQGPFERDGVEYELTGEFAKFDPDKHEACVTALGSVFFDGKRGISECVNHGYRHILRRKEQEWPKWYTSNVWFDGTRLIELKDTKEYRCYRENEVGDWIKRPLPQVPTTWNEITKAEAKKLIAELQDKQWPQYWGNTHRSKCIAKMLDERRYLFTGSYCTEEERVDSNNHVAYERAADWERITAAEYEKRLAEEKGENEFDKGRSADWRNTLDENGVPTCAPSKCEHGYGCQYCGGPLDAKEGVGQYECPWCMARFPERKAEVQGEKEPSVTRGCGICGGKLAMIRGKHPQDDEREVCPTCLQERMDQIINAVCGPVSGIADALNKEGEQQKKRGAK